MQDNIRPSFRDDRSLEETIESLRSGKIKPEDIPPIRIGEINGEIYTLDHRRLVAFREAGLPIRYQKATKRELEEESGRKMKTRSDGNHINIRKGEFK